MKPSRSRNILKRTLEGLAAVALVLVFFAILLMVFNALFPQGTGLQGIFRSVGDDNRRSDDQRIRSLLLSRGSDSSSLETDSRWAARLERVKNDVKSKRAADIAWRPAERGMELFNLDAIQTMDKSSALIRFDNSNFIDLGNSSLIVIRRMEKDLLYQEKRSFMVVVDGEMRGQISGDDEDAVYLEVATPNAVARLKSETGSTDGIEFRIDVDEDAASAITVFTGSAEVEAAGQTVALADNQMTLILGDNAPSSPVALPAAVRLDNPPKGHLFPFRSLPPRVSMTWTGSGADQYRLQIASDPEFVDLLLEEMTDRTEFVHGNLQAGDYYWRVSQIRQGLEGRFSRTGHFRIRQDGEPPGLQVSLPDGVVHADFLLLTGTTEPDARLYVAGSQVALEPDGSFRHRLELQRGINVVVIEAVDAAGNVSYRSELVNSKY